MSQVVNASPSGRTGLPAGWKARWGGQNLPQLAPLWTACRQELTVLLVFSAAISVLMLAPSVYMLQLYDRVLYSRSELTLLAVSLMTLFLMGVGALLDWSRGRLVGRGLARLDCLVGERVLAASLGQALAFSQGGAKGSSPAGDPLADWATLKRFLNGPGVPAFLDAPWTPLYVAVLFMLHPVLGWAALAFVALQAAVVWQGHQRLVAPRSAAVQAQADATAFVQAKLKNAEMIGAMGMTGPLFRRWQRKHAAARVAQGRAVATGDRVALVSKWLRYSQQSLGLAIGAVLVIQDELTAGAMFAASFLLARALAPIDQLVGNWPALIEARAAGAQLLQALRLHAPHQASPQHTAARKVASPRGRLVLDRVGLSLPGRSQPLLQDVSFQALPGTLTLVTGPSGSGKSTLARMLVGIWPPSAGTLLRDGMALSQWQGEDPGAHVGYLPQEVHLNEGSVAENIARMGTPDPAKVMAAAHAAGLHALILGLPQGYDTQVGEGGRSLSGGLRQRVALARALYADPGLVVLDEPNAQLDEAGDAALKQALKQLKARGATVIVITHRPALSALADQVIGLEGGRALRQAWQASP